MIYYMYSCKLGRTFIKFIFCHGSLRSPTNHEIRFGLVENCIKSQLYNFICRLDPTTKSGVKTGDYIEEAA